MAEQLTEFIQGKCYRTNPEFSDNDYVIYATGPTDGIIIKTNRDIANRPVGHDNRTLGTANWATHTFIECKHPELTELIDNKVYKYKGNPENGDIIFTKYGNDEPYGIVISATMKFKEDYLPGKHLMLNPPTIRRCQAHFIEEVVLQNDFKVGQLVTDKTYPYVGLVMITQVNGVSIKGVTLKAENPSLIGTEWTCIQMHYDRIIIIDDLELSLKPKVI